MTRAYFIDLDGTLVPPGNPRGFIPGAKEMLDSLGADPDHHIFFFSCWAFTQDDVRWLLEQFPYAKGCIRKPLADEYVFIDDKLRVDLCDTQLP